MMFSLQVDESVSLTWKEWFCWRF